MGLVDEAVVVDEVAVAGVVGRVDIDAADRTLVAHAQGAQGVEVVALDDQVVPWCVAVTERRVELQGDVVAVYGRISLDLVALPHQPQLSLGIAPPQQADQCVAVEILIGRHQPASARGSA